MEWADVLQRIEAGEDRTTEFKREFGSDLSAIGKAICAFANGEGGLIVLGVDDSGVTVGLNADPHKVHEQLTNFLQNGFSEPVGARCGRQEHKNGRWVHWIEAPRIRGPEPLRYGRRFYIRRERSSVEPSPHELQELFNVFGFAFTEEQTIRSASVDDIDINSFRSFQRSRSLETEEEPQPPIEDDLRNAHVLREVDGAFRPTLYGSMVFGRDPQAHPYTGSFQVQCAAYAGRDRASETILVGDAKGRLDEQVRRALGWMDALGRTETYDGIYRHDRPLAPKDVLREALVNAVVHRDYAIAGARAMLEVFPDRIDVTSPGTLPNHMTAESVKTGSLPRSRNEWMATAMVVMGMMEQRGRGWPKMRQGMRAFNDTEPELVNDEGGKFVRVTFRLAPEPA